MTHNDINALGFVEVRGLAAAIETADAMLKCADVRLLRQLLRDPMQTTITVEGGLGACRAAVDAGRAAAERLDALVASSVMGRPADDTAEFVLRLAEAGRNPFGPPSPAASRKPAAAKPAAADAPATSEASAAETVDAALLAALAGVPKGCGALALAKQIGGDPDTVRQQLETLCTRGIAAKRHGRYLLVKPEGDGK